MQPQFSLLIDERVVEDLPAEGVDVGEGEATIAGKTTESALIRLRNTTRDWKGITMAYLVCQKKRNRISGLL